MNQTYFPYFQVKVAGQVIETTHKAIEVESAMSTITRPVEVFEINADGTAKLLKRIK